MLGTYTTIDYPASIDLTTEEYGKLKEDAYAFLKRRFKKIRGDVRKLLNPHDFGPYYSFEIDYPVELENIENDDGMQNFIKEEWLKKEEWENKADKIQRSYNKKFEKYL